MYRQQLNIVLFFFTIKFPIIYGVLRLPPGNFKGVDEITLTAPSKDGSNGRQTKDRTPRPLFPHRPSGKPNSVILGPQTSLKSVNISPCNFSLCICTSYFLKIHISTTM